LKSLLLKALISKETGGQGDPCRPLVSTLGHLDEPGGVDQEQNAVEAEDQARDHRGNLGDGVAGICHVSLSFNFGAAALASPWPTYRGALI
jgi:hypothetical protein